MRQAPICADGNTQPAFSSRDHLSGSCQLPTYHRICAWKAKCLYLTNFMLQEAQHLTCCDHYLERGALHTCPITQRYA